MVICYELFKAAESPGEILDESTNGAGRLERDWDQPLATSGDVERFHAHLERVLIALDFHDPENPRQLMQRLRRLFGRIRLDAMEISILRGMLGHIEDKMKDSAPP